MSFIKYGMYILFLSTVFGQQKSMWYTKNIGTNERWAGFYEGAFNSYYTYKGISLNPYLNQGSAILGNLTYGGDGTNPIGTIHGISSVVDVLSCGDSKSEMVGMFIKLRSEVPTRLWGVDLGVMGPLDSQADLLTGLVNAVNNYNDSRPINGSVGAIIISKPNSGPGNRHDLPTYPIDAGLAIVGYSNTLTDPLSVFDRALQVGGWASGWMNNRERSKFKIGIDVSDYMDKGIYIHDPQSNNNGGYALIVAPDAGRVGIGTTNPVNPFEVVPGKGSAFSINIENDQTLVKIIDNSENPILQIGRNSINDFVNLEYNGSSLNVYNKNLTVGDHNFGVGVIAELTSKVDINNSSAPQSQLRLRNSFTPESSLDTRGNTGDIAWDDDYFYVKTSGGWKRAALTSF